MIDYLANLEAEAQYRNGLRSLEGRGVAQDFAEAKAWFEKAAAQGNVAAMEQLGFFCERGLGGEVDIAKAKEWYEKAADKGNAAAMVGLGKMYFRGYDGIEKNYGTALEWFKKAALTWRLVAEDGAWRCGGRPDRGATAVHALPGGGDRPEGRRQRDRSGCLRSPRPGRFLRASSGTTVTDCKKYHLF